MKKWSFEKLIAPIIYNLVSWTKGGMEFDVPRFGWFEVMCSDKRTP